MKQLTLMLVLMLAFISCKKDDSPEVQPVQLMVVTTGRPGVIYLLNGVYYDKEQGWLYSSESFTGGTEPDTAVQPFPNPNYPEWKSFKQGVKLLGRMDYSTNPDGELVPLTDDDYIEIKLFVNDTLKETSRGHNPEVTYP